MTGSAIALAYSAGVVALTAAITYRAPDLSRRGIFFSVTVPPEFRRTDLARRILRGYRVSAAVSGIVAVILALAARPPLGLVFAMTWVAAFTLAALARARSQVLPHASPLPPVREASLGPRTPAAEDRLWIQALPLLPLLASAAYVALRWADLPSPMPVHWGFDGRPNRWLPKTPASVMTPFIVGTLLCAGIAVMSHFTRKSTRRPGSGAIEEQFRATIAQFVLAAELFVAIAFSLIAVAPLLSRSVAARLFEFLPFGTLGVLAILLVWTVRVARRRQSPAAAPGDFTPDACWKAGIFYVNPGDPALFVEKRMGLGYTLNFAHVGAWALVAGLLALAAVALLIARS